MVTGSVGLDI